MKSSHSRPFKNALSSSQECLGHYGIDEQLEAYASGLTIRGATDARNFVGRGEENHDGRAKASLMGASPGGVQH